MRPSENPFATHRLESLELSLDGTSLDELCARVEVPGSRYCILGAHGSGKTLLLDSLRASLIRKGAHCRSFSLEHGEQLESILHRAQGAQLLSEAFVFIDGADSISRPRWLALRAKLRRAKSVIVTSHSRAIYPVLCRMQMTPELFHSLVGKLVDPQTIGVDLSELLREHNGNARNAFLSLYDLSAHRVRIDNRPLRSQISG
ncbi:MAG: hypothetical protein IT290_04540 [Deltaproteobacteria bacterium]|nr:hypothetical protein [Deltaproteobacteria bacterium]